MIKLHGGYLLIAHSEAAGGWKSGIGVPCHPPIHPPPAQGCGAAPSPPTFHGVVLTPRFSGPAREQVFHFLRRAVTFQQAFRRGLYFLRSELKRSPTASQPAMLLACPRDTGRYVYIGEKSLQVRRRCKNPVKPLKRGSEKSFFTRTNWMRSLLNFI